MNNDTARTASDPTTCGRPLALVGAPSSSGDVEIFSQGVAAHDAGLRVLAFRLLGQRHDVDDAMQEAYLKAYAAWPQFAGRSSMRTWLYRITYNVCIDQLRRRPRLGIATAAEEMESAIATGPPTASDVAVRLDVSAALATLAPRDRALVMLVDGLGFDYARVATILGVPVGTVASRLNRLRARLRPLLTADSAA